MILGEVYRADGGFRACQKWSLLLGGFEVRTSLDESSGVQDVRSAEIGSDGIYREVDRWMIEIAK